MKKNGGSGASIFCALGLKDLAEAVDDGFDAIVDTFGQANSAVEDGHVLESNSSEKDAD